MVVFLSILQNAFGYIIAFIFSYPEEEGGGKPLCHNLPTRECEVQRGSYTHQRICVQRQIYTLIAFRVSLDVTSPGTSCIDAEKPLGKEVAALWCLLPL